MGRYLQKISLFPFAEGELWTGWELEGCDGSIEGLLPADDLTTEELSRYGVSEFPRIPAEYLGGNPVE